MRGGQGQGPYTPPCETLVVISSWPNPILVAREVLAYQCVAFHPCMWGLRGGTTAVAAVLISYDDLELLTR
jgi:hypothetical protein